MTEEKIIAKPKTASGRFGIKIAFVSYTCNTDPDPPPRPAIEHGRGGYYFAFDPVIHRVNAIESLNPVTCK